MMTTPNRKLIYIADPMCSWCWGFEPVIQNLVERMGDRADFSIILGGLRSETAPVPPQRRMMYRQLYPRITEQTGQPFNCDLVESDDFIYDTEPPCRAVVAVRSMHGDLKALQMFSQLQQAFYENNRDITQADCCVEIAAEVGVDPNEFSQRFASDEFKQATQADFQQGRELGVSGFPTVLLTDEQSGVVLTHGYQPAENLREPLDAWLNT